MRIERRIGVSTLWMPKDNYTLFQAIDAVAEAGFNTIELVPIDCQGTSGFPFTKRSVGMWLRTFDKKSRERLAQKLKCFDLITVHSPHTDLNIASVNQGIRDESIRQYIEVLKFAIEIGAKVVTWHPGHQSSGFLRDEKEIMDFNVQFAEMALQVLAQHDIMLGYEVADAGFKHLKNVVERINHPKFGLNIDIGHCTMVEGPLPDRWIIPFKEKIVEIHVHGAYQRSDRGIMVTHQPLGMNDNNLINIPRIIKLLKESHFEGPFIFEILSNDLSMYLENSLAGKKRIVELWEGIK